MTAWEVGRIISFLCFYFRTTGASSQSPRREQDLVGPCELGLFFKITSWQEELSGTLVPVECPCPFCGPGDGRRPL